ncbi:MAG: cytochrome c oxidase assembly protein [Burkholderiaceae bacterium]|nr:MAG: cytochrome c oxidase assembly protein [Burkholderiaceae bacterium]TAM01645.1 MAG: cytochrome c oxidase assembly protein [Pusillimonas sp.]
MDLIGWLTPWEFSPALVVMFIVSGALFARGSRVHHVNVRRQVLFWVGFVFLYLSLHTRVDYYAERLFFAHRLQHLVLHHLGPLLIMGAFPGQIMRAGLPVSVRFWLRDFRRSATGRVVVGVLTNPVLIPFMFVFLVLVWVVPTVQFYSMLDWRLYRLMNWSVLVSGILYWNLILDRRPSPPAAVSPGLRVISPIITTVPQMLAGAIITFTEHDLYPVFDLCGRAIPGMSAMTDQAIGGLTMWVLAGFVEVAGLLFALGALMNLSSKGRLPNKRERAQAESRAAALGV